MLLFSVVNAAADGDGDGDDDDDDGDVCCRQGWSLTCSSADCLTLCLEMLQTLLEVFIASSTHTALFNIYLC